MQRRKRISLLNYISVTAMTADGAVPAVKTDSAVTAVAADSAVSCHYFYSDVHIAVTLM